MSDANENKEKVQKITNVINVYGYYQREIEQMDEKLVFLILFLNHHISKWEHKKEEKC